MQRRNFLKLGLAGSTSLLAPGLAFSAQQLLDNEDLMIALEKRLGFRVISLDQHSTGLFHAELDHGGNPFVLYSKDVQQWYSKPHFS